MAHADANGAPEDVVKRPGEVARQPGGAGELRVAVTGASRRRAVTLSVTHVTDW